MTETTADERARAAVFRRLSSYYVASFAVLGIYMQFFPRWLSERRGCSTEAAAFVLSGQIWARTFAGPLWSQRVDRHGRPRAVLVTLSCLSLLVAASLGVIHAPLGLFCVCVAFGCVYPPIHPILDSLTLSAAARTGLTFSGVRLWGSMSFLLAIVALGWYLRVGSDVARYDAVLWVLLIGCALLVIAGWRLPDERRPARVGAPIRELLASPRLLMFLAAAGLIQGSHAAYYTLSTNDWHAHGIDELTAGLLWAEGVVAEVVFFFVARKRLAHLRPTTLMLIGGGAAIVRWICLAATRNVWLLVAVNWLHAASFACTFLGAVWFIQKRVPSHQQTTAQGLLGAISSGACTALATILAGFVYRHAGNSAYLAMAGLAALGTLLTITLRRRRE